MRDIIVELSNATPTIMVELEASGPKGDPGRDFSVLGYFFTLEEPGDDPDVPGIGDGIEEPVTPFEKADKAGLDAARKNLLIALLEV